MKSFNLSLTHVDGDADALFRTPGVPHCALSGVWLDLRISQRSRSRCYTVSI